MTFRVTNRQTTEQFIFQMQQQKLMLEKARQEVSSGIRIQLPSDDSGAAGPILSFQSAIQRLQRHKERTAFATNVLQHQDTTLESADNLLIRAKELATQGANGTLTEDQRRIIAEEVFQLRDQLVSLANVTYQGRYLYGGAADGVPPFAASTTPYTNPATAGDPARTRIVYTTAVGSTLERSVNISDTDSIRINTRGDEVFSRAISALERLGRALDGYTSTIDAGTGLPDGGGAAYTLPADVPQQQNDILRALDEIEAARINNVLPQRTSVGARMNRIDQLSDILDNLIISNERSRSALQDADVFDAAARFSQLQTSLEALLASGATINRLSLLNFI